MSEGEGSAVERNKELIRRFVEEVQNKKDEAAYYDLVDQAFVNFSAPPGLPSDREGGKLHLFALLNAFPDAQCTVDKMIAEGEEVVTQKTFRGTHTAEFAGVPATGKTVEFQYVDIMRVRNDKIVEHWLSLDQLGFMQQLGVIPPFGGGAS